LPHAKGNNSYKNPVITIAPAGVSLDPAAAEPAQSAAVQAATRSRSVVETMPWPACNTGQWPGLTNRGEFLLMANVIIHLCAPVTGMSNRLLQE
jgi:hypothetical protein